MIIISGGWNDLENEISLKIFIFLRSIAEQMVMVNKLREIYFLLQFDRHNWVLWNHLKAIIFILNFNFLANNCEMEIYYFYTISWFLISIHELCWWSSVFNQRRKKSFQIIQLVIFAINNANPQNNFFRSQLFLEVSTLLLS